MFVQENNAMGWLRCSQNRLLVTNSSLTLFDWPLKPFELSLPSPKSANQSIPWQ